MRHVRRFLICGVAAAVVVPGLVSGLVRAQASSSAVSLCSAARGRSAHAAVASDHYEVMLGEWYARAPICVHTNGGPEFTVTRSAINLDMVGAFPNISTTGRADGLPVQISSMGSPTSTWNTVTPRSGEYDVTYDITVGQHRNSMTWSDGAEVMVWLSTRGHPYPLGHVVARNVRISGALYTVWVLLAPAGTSYQTIVTIIRQRQTRSVTNLNLGRAVRLAARYGRFGTSLYVIRVQAGIEIIKGGQGFETKYFSYRPG